MAIEAVANITKIRDDQAVQESPFYIPMTGPASRPRRSLKHDDTFIVLDSHGDIGASAGGPDGLFNADTRYLARLELVLDDVQPLLLGSNLRDDNSALTVDLTNPDVYRGDRIVLQKDMLHIVRTIFLWRGTAYQRIGVQNHGDRRASFELTLLFDNDFADLFEVRGDRRPRRGIASGKVDGPADVTLDYHGLDGAARTTGLHFEPRPAKLSVNAATYQFELEPQQMTSLIIAVSCNKPLMHKPAPFFRGLLAHRREMRRSTAGATSVETSNNIFNEVLCQAMADLNMLMTETPQGRYPYAGIPWYSTTFGRDGLITALQMLWVDPRIARGVLMRLGLLPGQVGRSAGRCGAGEDPARNARRRDGGAARSAVCAILRQRRFDAAVRAAGGPLCRAHRRRRDAGRVVARDRGRAALDRRRRRSRPGRLRRVSARFRAGARQSGLEGFLRRDLSCRRTARRGLHRAGRGAGLCVCRQAAGRALRVAPGAGGEGRPAGDRGTGAGRAIRSGVLVRGTRHLCARARRRQAAVQGADLQCRPAAVHRHRRARTAPARSPPI